MAFRERVKSDLSVALREGVNLLKEGSIILKKEVTRLTKQGTTAVGLEARRVTKISQLRYDHYRYNQKAQSSFTELGGLVYDLIAKDPDEFPLDKATRQLFEETKELESHIKKLDSEIRKLSKGK